MKMQKLLAAAAIVFLTSVGAASAASVMVDGQYTVSYTPITPSNTSANPTITDDLSSSFSFVNTQAETNFITVAPCNGCESNGFTASGTITVSFKNFTFNGVAATIESVTPTPITGTYEAKYGGTKLPCTSSGNGNTDCVDWGSNTTLTGSTTYVIDFTDNAVLDITLYNANDWNITPEISFNLATDPTATPLPAALPLFAGGLGVLGFAGSWRRRRAAKATASI
jgi:hypothetical protein